MTKNELHSNASSVKTDLGGFDHGYFGLFLTDAKYTCVSGTPFVEPNFPTAPTIPPLVTAVEAVRLPDQHAEHVCLCREFKNEEKALLRHVQY